MPPAGADVGVLRRDNPPAPVDPHNARPDALPRRLAKVVVQDFAIDPETRVQDCDVGREKVHMHLRRLARARPERAIRAVQPLHQVAEPLAARGPGAVDGDELRVVRERLREALGIVPVPRRVEAVLKLANQVFVRLTHWVSLIRRRRARSGPGQFSFTPDCSMICLNREASLRMRSARASWLTGEASMPSSLKRLRSASSCRMRSISESRRDTMATGVLAGT